MTADSLYAPFPLLETILATLMFNVDSVAFLMNFYAHDVFREKLLNELTRKFGRWFIVKAIIPIIAVRLQRI